MTSTAPTPDAGAGTTSTETLEVVGLRLGAAGLLACAVLDGVYLGVRFFSTGYFLGDNYAFYTRPDDAAYAAWIVGEACLGWLLATRAPRIARWLRARTRVDLPT